VFLSGSWQILGVLFLMHIWIPHLREGHYGLLCLLKVTTVSV